MFSDTINASKLPTDFAFFSEVSLSKLKLLGQGVTKAITNHNINIKKNERWKFLSPNLEFTCSTENKICS